MDECKPLPSSSMMSSVRGVARRSAAAASLISPN